MSKRRGQGMVEYIIIVGLIAIVLIGVVKAFGEKVTAGFTAVTGGIDGVTAQMDVAVSTPEGWRGESPNGNVAPMSHTCRHTSVDPRTRICRSCGRRP
jgi:Flp pilus assembly pilin Flp